MPDRTHGFECALRVRIEKIVLAERRDAALNGFDATEHCPGIEVLRPKNLGCAVDPFQPWQKREIFPYGAQQDLIKMSVCVDEPRHQNAADGIYGFFLRVDRFKGAFANFHDGPLFDTHIATERLPIFRHWHDQGVREDHGTY